MLNLQNNKLTETCARKLSMWDKNKNLCFLLIDGNPEVSDEPRKRCQDFTERNRERIYNSLDGDTPCSMNHWPFSPLGFNESIDPVKKADADANASLPPESPNKAENGTPEAATTSGSSPLPQQTANSAIASEDEIEEETLLPTTPIKPIQINLSCVSDKSTPPVMRTPNAEQTPPRRASVSLLLSAPLVLDTFVSGQSFSYTSALCCRSVNNCSRIAI